MSIENTPSLTGKVGIVIGGAAALVPRAAEADDVALAVMACITHLRHTTGTVITADAARHL